MPFIRSLMTGVSEAKKARKKLTVTENQKYQQTYSNLAKFIELGGSNKPNFPINTRNFLKNGSNNFEDLHMPQNLRPERVNYVNVLG